MKKLLFLLFAIFTSLIGDDKNVIEVIKYPMPDSEKVTHRKNYYLELIDAIIEATEQKYGKMRCEPYIHDPKVRDRAFQLLDSKEADIFWAPATLETDERFLSVKYPLLKGLLSYRIFLIKGERVQDFRNIASLDELKKLKVGQGDGWSTVQIYKDNGFNIITYPHYGALFKMLDAGIFDYFSRGINEVWEEYEIYKKEIPDIHVEESILLQHPIVMNFFFSKTKRGEQLAGRFEEGF